MGKAFLYGVGGGGSSATQQKTVPLDMSEGDQIVVPGTGYDAMTQVTITKPATYVKENIKKDVDIGGIIGTYEGSAIPNLLDGLVDGSIVDFTMPSGKTKVHRYLFYNVTSLQTANLQGATQIEDYAFYGTTNAEIILPSTLTNIAQYSFYNAGKSSALMELSCPNSACNVGSYAFQQAKISKVTGKFGSISGSAFSGCAYLSIVDITQCSGIGAEAFYGATSANKLHLVINGAIGNSAFVNNAAVSDFQISGTITALGTNSFQHFGHSRTSPSTNILTFDFSNSTFKTVPILCFGATSSAAAPKYFCIIFPNTCTSIGTQAFQYIQNSDIFFKGDASTIQSNTFANMSNTNLWVPYNSVNAYRTKANWSASSVQSAIKGWAPENTFTMGETLPTINEEGYGCTWYSDKECTTQVTTVSDPTQKLYCIVGTTVLAYRITSVNTMDCNVTFSDGVDTYSEGDQVPAGVSLTIASTATDPDKTQVYMFDINGTAYQPSSSETITVASDIAVICLYYDGINPPVNPVLNNNTWQQILIGCQNGLAGTLWAVGDTKTDSTGLVWSIVDLKDSRYPRANGTGYTKCAFMPIGRCFNQNTTWYTSSYGENYSQSLLNTKLSENGVYFNQIDPTLAALVNANKIIVKASQANSSATVDCTVGFFAASYTEFGYTGSYGNATSAETVCNGVTMGAFEYFADNQNSKRIFKDSNNTARNCWTRSRFDSGSAVCVSTSGSYNGNYVAYGYYAVPCFAW